MSEADDIKAELDKLSAMMTEFSKTIEPLKKESEKLDQIAAQAYQVYLDEVAKVKHQKSVIQERLNEASNGINKLKQQEAILNAKYHEIKQREEAQAKAEALQNEWLALHKRWDALTAGAPWREWAKDHQIEGGKKLTGDRKVIVADPMGLGKTLTSIIACDMVQKATQFASPKTPFLGEEKEFWDHSTGEYVTKIVDGVIKPAGRKILYICPAPLVQNVRAEFQMWAPHRTVWYLSGMTKAERDAAISMFIPIGQEYVVIINYEAWRKDSKLLDALAALEFDTIIIDEAHTIKEVKTNAYRGVRKLVQETEAPYVIPMTGTPILNRPQELFALLSLVDPNQFYNMNSFLFQYCEQDDNGFWTFKPGGLDLISKKISKNFLRRTKDQAGIELPEKTVITHRLPVDTDSWPEQAKIREQMTKHYAILLSEDKAITAAAMIAVFTRLRQIETWPAGIEVKDAITGEIKLKVDVEESQKVDYLIRKGETGWDGLIPEAIADERCVLFSQFKAPLREIKRRCEDAGYRAVILDGETPDSVKEEIRMDFDARHTPDRNNAKWDIVLCNYRVGGQGMNLTAASQMFILDEEWNPGKRDQAYDRIHRMGQELPVTIHLVRTEGTIDDWLAGIMEAKEGLVEGFNSAMMKDSFLDWANGSGLL